MKYELKRLPCPRDWFERNGYTQCYLAESIEPTLSMSQHPPLRCEELNLLKFEVVRYTDGSFGWVLNV